jgi:hypothetical protein
MTHFARTVRHPPRAGRGHSAVGGRKGVGARSLRRFAIKSESEGHGGMSGRGGKRVAEGERAPRSDVHGVCTLSRPYPTKLLD